MNGNLDARGVQQRYTLFLIGLVAGSLGAALILAGRLPASWGALLFIPFLLGSLGYFQARERTCAALAAQGLRVDEKGAMVKVCDPCQRRALRERGLRVAALSCGVALVLTALVRLLSP